MAYIRNFNSTDRRTPDNVWDFAYYIPIVLEYPPTALEIIYHIIKKLDVYDNNNNIL